MSKSYPGNFITGNPVPLSQTSNNGIWDLKDKYHATTAGKWQEADGIYEIGRSLRFRASSTAFLSRTQVAGNTGRFTLSFWVKRGAKVSSGQDEYILTGATATGGRQTTFQFTSSGALNFGIDSAVGGQASTTAVFRDPSAWYHIVLTYNSSNASGQRSKVYVNGSSNLFTSDTTSGNSFWNTVNYTMEFGRNLGGGFSRDIDGHYTEVNYVDGQELDPSYFGYTDSITGIWQPKRYTGTYGNNGFYLPFTENQTVQALGRNFAGGTNWIKNSQNFADSTGTGWQKVRSNVTANAGIAPDGTNTATKFFENTANGTHDLNLADPAGGITFGTPYCFSFYAKSTGENRDQISYNLVNNGYTSTVQWFGMVGPVPNGQAGTAVAGGVSGGATDTGYGSQHVGNGWYRFWGSGTFAQGASSTFNVTLSLNNTSGTPTSVYTGNGSSGILIWGAMVNQGTTPDAYVPTTGSILNNNWTPNNISVTAGATYDSMVDSPTNVFNQDVNDNGGVVSGNYSVLSSIDKAANTSVILAGNQAAYFPFANSNNAGPVRGTLAMPSGKWYFEFYAGIEAGDGNSAMVGFTTANGRNLNSTSNASIWAGQITHIGVDASVFNNAMSFTTNGWSSSLASGTVLFNTYAALNIVNMAIDLDAGRIWIGKNGTWYNSGNPATGANPTATFTKPTGLVYTQFEPITSGNNGNRSNINVNFGQRPFAYTTPAGFRTLNTTNLQTLGTAATPNVATQPNKWFDVTLYGGTGSPTNIVNSGFKPDLVWTKTRTSVNGSHVLIDSVRGPGLGVFANSSNVESGGATVYATSFNDNGFGVNLGTGTNAVGESYVAWQWKAGNTNVTNTAGSITSIVNASPAAGFSVVSYTLNNSTFTVGHGLGVAPKVIIVKNRDTTNNWDVYHASIGAGVRLQLNSTATPTSTTQVWNNTAPTSTVFSGNSAWWSNPSTSKMIAYCFSEVDGYSKFDSYTGNGSTDGPFIHTGFRPKFVMWKNTSDSTDWAMQDSVRNTTNPTNSYLNPASAGGEVTDPPFLDFVSNGFKIRRSTTGTNASGNLYIYMAFAESPFALNNRAR